MGHLSDKFRSHLKSIKEVISEFTKTLNFKNRLSQEP